MVSRFTRLHGFLTFSCRCCGSSESRAQSELELVALISFPEIRYGVMSNISQMGSSSILLGSVLELVISCYFPATTLLQLQIIAGSTAAQRLLTLAFSSKHILEHR